jgi:phage gpG-like protein
MQDFSNILKNIIDDIAVEFSEQYEENFRGKSFFNEAWKRSASPNKTGSLMVRSGALKKSIRHTKSATGIMFYGENISLANNHDYKSFIMVTIIGFLFSLIEERQPSRGIKTL